MENVKRTCVRHRFDDAEEDRPTERNDDDDALPCPEACTRLVWMGPNHKWCLVTPIVCPETEERRTTHTPLPFDVLLHDKASQRVYWVPSPLECSERLVVGTIHRDRRSGAHFLRILHAPVHLPYVRINLSMMMTWFTDGYVLSTGSHLLIVLVSGVPASKLPERLQPFCVDTGRMFKGSTYLRKLLLMLPTTTTAVDPSVQIIETGVTQLRDKLDTRTWSWPASLERAVRPLCRFVEPKP